MLKNNNLFRFRFNNKTAYILQLINALDIYYIEISPIVPDNSEIYFNKKVELKDKTFSIATFNTKFNIVTKDLNNKGDYFTCVKSIKKDDEVDLIFIQLKNNEKLQDIKMIVKDLEFDYTTENNYTKLIVKI